jgi:hypothetical protein
VKVSVEIHKLETEITAQKELSVKDSVHEIPVISVPTSKPKSY